MEPVKEKSIKRIEGVESWVDYKENGDCPHCGAEGSFITSTLGLQLISCERYFIVQVCILCGKFTQTSEEWDPCKADKDYRYGNYFYKEGEENTFFEDCTILK